MDVSASLSAREVLEIMFLKIKSMRSGFVTTDQLYFQLKTESK